MNEAVLSPGFTARPATLDDVEAAVALFNACSVADIGSPQYSVDELRNDWSAPDFDLQADTHCVFNASGEMAGYGHVWDSPPYVILWTRGRVHPQWTSQGLGSYLLQWTETRAAQSLPQAPAGARVTMRQSIADGNTQAKALLQAHGYERVRSWYQMAIELEGPPPVPDFPEGLSLRTFIRNQDLPAVIRADQDAFRDHWGFVERPLDSELANWGQWIDDDPDFDASLWFLAVDDASGEIAGICLCSRKLVEDPEMGWVNALGVRRPWRRRGLALAMLRHAFGEFHRRGKARVGLGVDADSLTGALDLYRKAGMHVQRTSYTYEKELRAGEDLTTKSLD